MLNAKLLKFKFAEYVLPLSTMMWMGSCYCCTIFQLKAPAVSSTLKSVTTADAVYVFVIVGTVTLPAVSTETLYFGKPLSLIRSFYYCHINLLPVFLPLMRFVLQNRKK